MKPLLVLFTAGSNAKRFSSRIHISSGILKSLKFLIFVTFALAPFSASDAVEDSVFPKSPAHIQFGYVMAGSYVPRIMPSTSDDEQIRQALSVVRAYEDPCSGYRIESRERDDDSEASSLLISPITGKSGRILADVFPVPVGEREFISIPVSARILPDISVAPGYLDLGRFEKGVDITSSLRIAGPVGFEIAPKSETPLPGVTVFVSPENVATGTSYVVTAQIDGQRFRDVSGLIEFECSGCADTSATSVFIYFIGRVVPRVSVFTAQPYVLIRTDGKFRMPRLLFKVLKQHQVKSVSSLLFGPEWQPRILQSGDTCVLCESPLAPKLPAPGFSGEFSDELTFNFEDATETVPIRFRIGD